MPDRWTRLSELAVHGANVQPGQVVLLSSELGHARLARAVAAAAYQRGARFVDAVFFDPRQKLARLEHADPATLDYVPPWYGRRLLDNAESRGARIAIAGLTDAGVFDGVDPTLLGKDRLPWLKEVGQLISERTTNWCVVPCPHPEWAKIVHPDLPAEEAYELLWREIEHVLRLDEPDPNGAWDERIAELRGSAERLSARGFESIELKGTGTDLRVGLLPTSTWLAADFERIDGLRHLPNLPTEEVFTTPDPERTEGHVASTKPLVLIDGTIIRGLRVRFEKGVAVEIDADENANALRSALDVDESARKLGELALVDDKGRIGPLGTTFYHTLLDENAASHIAFGSGFAFAADAADNARVNESGAHIDFMIGSPELLVDGVTPDGERVPVLRGGTWQI